MTHSKEKGNAYERKIAKLLNKWMFGDKVILKRASDSGALKDIYVSDIIPYGQLPEEWNGRWPFCIELKHGYEDSIPTPFRYETIHKWIKKAYKESLIHNQYIIYLIIQFPHQQNIVFTNYIINKLNYVICFNIELTKNNYQPFYCYKLNDLLKEDFYNLYN